MTHSLNPADQHISRLHHTLARVREHRAQIDQAARDEAGEHYARRNDQTQPSGDGGPDKGSTNV